jgi:hypothetical protein
LVPSITFTRSPSPSAKLSPVCPIPSNFCTKSMTDRSGYLFMVGSSSGNIA